jgi:hypothetical protein
MKGWNGGRIFSPPLLNYSFMCHSVHSDLKCNQNSLRGAWRTIPKMDVMDIFLLSIFGLDLYTAIHFVWNLIDALSKHILRLTGEYYQSNSVHFKRKMWKMRLSIHNIYLWVLYLMNIFSPAVTAFCNRKLRDLSSWLVCPQCCNTACKGIPALGSPVTEEQSLWKLALYRL